MLFIFTISIPAVHIAYSIQAILATETLLDLRNVYFEYPVIFSRIMLHHPRVSGEVAVCVQHDVFLQHSSVQPKPRGLNTQISLKKRPFLSLPLLVRPYY